MNRHRQNMPPDSERAQPETTATPINRLSRGNCDKFLPILIIAAAFIGMSWMSWRKWPDLSVDFGLQLYIPWQLSEGRMLYRDIAHLPGGPLSQYWNALLFTILRPSFNTLIAGNFAVLLVLLTFVYRAFR